MNREQKLEYIKDSITKYDSFSTFDVEASSSPAISVIGDTSVLLESFYVNYAEAVTYVGSQDISTSNIPYSELEDSVLDDIIDLIELKISIVVKTGWQKGLNSFDI